MSARYATKVMKADSHDAPAYVPVSAVARRLNCSPSTVRNYVQRSLLPAPLQLCDGGRWVFRAVELEAALLKWESK